jgi:hypothetical protein
MNNRILPALALSSVLAGCASMPGDLQQVGVVAGNLRNAIFGTGEAGSNVVNTNRPLATSEPQKLAGVRWDNSNAEKLNSPSGSPRATGNIVWSSPDKELVSVIVKPTDLGSKVAAISASGQVVAEACNRTFSGTGLEILKGITGTGPVGRQVVRQPYSATTTGEFAGLTDEQKRECRLAIQSVRTEVVRKGDELTGYFSQLNKGVQYTVTYTGTNRADIVLGLPTSSPTRALERR